MVQESDALSETVNDEKRSVMVGDTRDVPGIVQLLGDDRFSERYTAGALLGKGGMGEVRLFHDRRIGRDVAQKTLRPEISKSRISFERFLREARVQGQLEHPAVLPVYDLAVDPQGAVFFTMKRVRGTPLDEILDALQAGKTLERFNRRKLLTAFVQICLAIEFAHSRGVLHRDLKPANIMLGDYGEVLVLDWGLAKLIDADDPVSDEVAVPAISGESGDSKSTPTLAGSVLGTPGYMSPEQARGDTDGLDGRTDVYSLGAILFEIVYRETLHEGRGIPQRIASTIFGAEMRASHRKNGGEVSPELETICTKACALDPFWRYANARELADAVEGYLDGERDEERRKVLAEAHVAKAKSLVAEAEDAQKPNLRTEALREVGRALVLDPTHASALALLEILITQAPDEPSPEAREEIAKMERNQRRAVLHSATIRNALWLSLGLIALVFPLRDPSLVYGILASLAALFLYGLYVAQRAPTSRLHWRLLVVFTATVTGLLACVAGPFMVVPTLAATNSTLFAPQTTIRDRNILHGALVLSIVVPAMLSVMGVIPRLITFTADGGILVESPIFAFHDNSAFAALILIHVMLVVFPGAVMGRFFDRLHQVEARAIVQSWYLRQLLPKRG